jgi:hypothetical protein
MQKLLVWVSILLAVVVGGKFVYERLDKGAYEYTASTRVQGWLDGIKSDGDFQKGFNMWLRGGQSGIATITQDEFNMYVGQMNAMLKQRQLPSRIQSYEITGTTVIRGRDGLEPAVVDVSCTIDGTPVVIHAVEGEPLSWAD